MCLLKALGLKNVALDFLLRKATGVIELSQTHLFILCYVYVLTFDAHRDSLAMWHSLNIQTIAKQFKLIF